MRMDDRIRRFKERKKQLPEKKEAIKIHLALDRKYISPIEEEVPELTDEDAILAQIDGEYAERLADSYAMQQHCAEIEARRNEMLSRRKPRNEGEDLSGRDFEIFQGNEIKHYDGITPREQSNLTAFIRGSGGPVKRRPDKYM